MGIELEGIGELSLSIGKLADHTKKLNEPARPFYFEIQGSTLGNGATFLGRPPMGKIWNILTVTCTGDGDDHTTVAGNVGIYTDADTSGLSVGRCKIPALIIPSFVSISKGTLWAHSTGDVSANVSGVSGTAEVIVTVTVAEWKQSEVSKAFNN
jgi:hypothetical protein